ncbi:MAG: hypothetical protein AAF963_01940 [Bacteroidota bacterium]
MPERGRSWLKIITIFMGLMLVIGGGIVYWWLNHAPANPPEKAYTMHEEYKSEIAKADIEPTDDNTSAKLVETKKDVRAQELDKNIEVREEEKPFGNQLAEKSAKGTITKINKPQDRYYIIVSSFIDDDLAFDYANQLASQATDVMLILPSPGQYFYRVALDQKATLYDANEKLEEIKAIYGQNAWILKY